MTKQFTCDDGSGDVEAKLQVRIDFRKGVSFSWTVTGGSGAYERLHGSGSGVGVPGVPCGDFDACVLDLYEGGLHID